MSREVTLPDTSLDAYKALTPEMIYRNYSLRDVDYLDNNGNLCREKWDRINYYEDLYAISDLGRVKCLKKTLGNNRTQKEQIKVQRLMPKGYLTVVLWDNWKFKHFMVHKLVGQHFVPNPKNKPEINHKKGIKVDNRHFMLEWSTKSENRQHAYDTGLQKPTSGILHGMAKLNNEQVLEIFNSKESLTTLSKIYNVCFQSISHIKVGKTWTHITGKTYNPVIKK